MSKPAGKIRRTIRSAARTILLASFIIACLCECLALVALGKLGPQRRAQVFGKWAIRTMRGLGIQWRVVGRPPEHGLIVSNHLSYLDILVFGAAGFPAFVAKQEVRSWPVVGLVASLCGTIFIDRTRRSATHAVRSQMESALAEGQRLVLFPEGTSSDGSKILPFHSSLFESAVAAQAPVTAALIAYSIAEGDPGTDVCYWGGMSLGPHLLKMLYKGSVQATLKFSPNTFHFASRKEAAQVMQQEVERLREAPPQVSMDSSNPVSNVIV